MFNYTDLLKGSALLFIASLVARGSTLLLRYLAAVDLSPNDYGNFSLYVSLFLSIAAIASFSIGPALSKLAVSYKEQSNNRNVLYGNSLLLVAVTSSLACIIFFIVFLSSSRHLLTINIAVATVVGFIFWAYFQVSIGLSLADFKFRIVSIYEAGDGLIKLGFLCCIFILSSEIKVSSFIFAFTLPYVLLALLGYCCNAFILNIRVTQNPIKSYNRQCLSSILGHTFPLMTITFINLFFSFFLRFLLSKHSNSEVAIFDMAMVFYSVPRMIFVSLVRPIIPFASRRIGSKIRIFGFGKIIIVFGSLMCAAIGFYYSGFVGLFLSYIGLPEYLDSFPIFLIILSGSVLDLSFGFMSSYFQGYGKIKQICNIVILVFILMIPFSFYAISLHRVYGAAISYIMYYFFLAVLATYNGYRQVGFQFTNKKINQ